MSKPAIKYLLALPNQGLMQMTNSRLATRLIDRLNARTGRVALAVELPKAGLRTTGFGLDPRKLASIGQGQSYVADLSDEDVERLRGAGPAGATSDFDSVSELDTIDICVPTPLRKTRDPDMSYVVDAVERIAATPRNARGARIDHLSRHHRRARKDHTFRAVNIGLVNELALMCSRMQSDVWEVIDAAKTTPFGFKKRDIQDVRESPALDLMSVLGRKGARVAFSDPYVSTLPAELWGGDEDLHSIPVTPALLRSVDCVAILTDHTAFDVDQIAAFADVIVDTRNVTRGRPERVRWARRSALRRRFQSPSDGERAGCPS